MRRVYQFDGGMGQCVILFIALSQHNSHVCECCCMAQHSWGLPTYALHEASTSMLLVNCSVLTLLSYHLLYSSCFKICLERDMAYVNSCCLQNTTQVDVVADKLDMSAYCSTAASQPLYRLAAVANHAGSMACGHYTALCRSASTGKWFHCDDSSIREAKDVGGASSSAYILFYVRQDSN